MVSKVHFQILFLFIVFNLKYSFAQEAGTQIQCQAQYLEVNKNIGNGAQRLIGDVVFTHGNAKMYCDSAYFYQKANSLDAFGNVFINQGDTVHLYGKTLHYDGNSKMANIQGDVKLINRETTLTTSKLDYDLAKAIGYYTTKAHIVNNENTLESRIGYYYTREKTMYFRDSVVIVNPDYKMFSDTLKYNTATRTAYFFGPTNIIGDSSHIYCEKGWYNTIKDISELRKNAWVQKNDQTIYSEYIYYDKKTGSSIAKDKVKIIDQKENIILMGNNAKYNEITKFAFLTDQAEFIQISDKDSLFLHADTLRTVPDSLGKRILLAYKKVKFYRIDMQGMCDSMIYAFTDSVGRMFGQPILWTNNNQLNADQIIMYTKNRQMDKLKLNGSAFMVSKQDTNAFNQIKGKNMICYFSDNLLTRVDVMGNSQTIYYPIDGNQLVGVNKSECSNMKIYIKDNNPTKIIYYTNPTSVLYPLNQAPENELKLKGFRWLDDIRPKTKKDIY
jgi:lipopolysaccharide export system protein LptA